MHIEHISIVDARLVAKAYTGLVMYHIGVLHIETDELTPGDQMLTKVCVYVCMTVWEPCLEKSDRLHVVSRAFDVSSEHSYAGLQVHIHWQSYHFPIARPCFPSIGAQSTLHTRLVSRLIQALSELGVLRAHPRFVSVTVATFNQVCVYVRFLSMSFSYARISAVSVHIAACGVS